ncbi:MAG: glycine zipper 2TM domain-containing protein, partial [Thermodesulfobacteriota bacterium]
MLITNHGGAGRPVICLLLLFLAPIFSLAACAPARYRTVPVTTAQPPPPPTEVYFYPNRGQGPAQQDRDSYECYLWAKEQTGFDPSAPNLAPHHKLAVVPEAPPGADTAVGAMTGAILGAAVSSRGKGPEGALIGAVAGAII